MVKYDKLWDRMEKMGLFTSDLMTVLSPPTISALKKNQYVKLTTIENICIFLECGPGDIMEFDGDKTFSSWKKKENKFSSKHNGSVIKTASELLTEKKEQ